MVASISAAIRLRTLAADFGLQTSDSRKQSGSGRKPGVRSPLELCAKRCSVCNRRAAGEVAADVGGGTAPHLHRRHKWKLACERRLRGSWFHGDDHCKWQILRGELLEQFLRFGSPPHDHDLRTGGMI